MNEGRKTLTVKHKGPLSGGDVTLRLGPRAGVGDVSYKVTVEQPRKYEFTLDTPSGE